MQDTDTTPPSNVWVRLKGRLGNQMFQYAAGRALAQRLNTGLSLIAARHPSEGKWLYELAPFELDVDIIAPTPDDTLEAAWFPIEYTEPAEPNALLRKGPPLYVEQEFHFNKAFHQFDAPRTLVGYWQSPRYFAPVADQIRAAFDLRPFENDAVRDLVTRIESGPAVAVMVRRGDYVDLAKYFSLCGRDYYDRARKLIERNGYRPHYYVFSEDPLVAEELLDGWTNCTIVYGTDALETLLLIGRCDDFINSNSTFSWWGSWLGASDDALVVAPRYWFSRMVQQHIFVLDIYPDDWIIL